MKNYFDNPRGITTDLLGGFYLAGGFTGKVYKASYQDGLNSLKALDFSFNKPTDVTIDSSGNLYVVDIQDESNNKNYSIYKVDTSGNRTLFADHTADFQYPFSVAAGPDGFIYVADTFNHRVCRIAFDGTVSVFAGSVEGCLDGSGLHAKFCYPHGIAVDDTGNVYIGDRGNNLIRKITPDGLVTTLIDSITEQKGEIKVALDAPKGIALDQDGNIYFADSWNHRVCKIEKDGKTSTVAGSRFGYADGSGTEAQFSSLDDVAVDEFGNIYVTETWHRRVRKIDQNGNVSTFALIG